VPLAAGWLLQVTVLSLNVPVRGTAAMSRPSVLDSEYRRSFASTSRQFGASVGTSNRTRARAFSPMTGSGGEAVGSPTDDDRTVNS
jgi:hypothetical protein